MSFLNARSSFSKETKDEVKPYSHELEHQLKGKLGPGPAAYATPEKMNAVLRKTFVTMPKADRNLLGDGKNKKPGPHEYETGVAKL